MSDLTQALKTARGKNYYDILRQILAECGQQISDDGRIIKQERGGHLTLRDCGMLAVKYDLSLKATIEWLEETHVLRTGTYDMLQTHGMKAREVLEAGRVALVEAAEGKP